MMKLSVGLSRKVSDNHYGSKGGNIGLEVEVDSILLGDPSRLRGHMKQLFDMVRKALDEELNDGRENNPDEPENPALKGAMAGHEVVKPEQNAAIRMASGKQLSLIQELVRKAKIPFQPLLEERKVHALHELTLQQASGLITELKAMVG
jgi:hypothetical protein